MTTTEPIEGTLVVDIDGTLCDIKAAGQSYADLVPRADMIAKLREYQARGYRVLLFTARNMKTHNNNLGLIPVGRAKSPTPGRVKIPHLLTA